MLAQQETTPLTGLRGLAAIHVMLFHYYIGLSFSNPAATFLAHGYLAVDLFFCLSGFVMALNYGKMFASGYSTAMYLRFLGRRLARVYPLYLAATLAGFFLVVAGWLDAPQSGSLGSTLVLNLTMVQAWGFGQSIDGPGWSISAEWAAYLLFPILLVSTLFQRPWVGWLLVLICAAILATLSMLPASFVRNPKPEALLDLHNAYLAFPVMRCLPEFVLGVLAARLSATSYGYAIGSSWWMAPVICLTIFALMASPGTDLATVLLFPILLVSLASKSHLPGKILASGPAVLAGKLSYSIYLVHDLMTGLIGWMHMHIQVAGVTHAQTYAGAVCVMLTFPIAFLSYTYVEVPGRRWMRFIFEGKLGKSSTSLSYSGRNPLRLEDSDVGP